MTNYLPDLRHTHTSLLVKAGVQPNVIQKRLGWSSIRMLDTYAHLADGYDEEAVAVLASIDAPLSVRYRMWSP